MSLGPGLNLCCKLFTLEYKLLNNLGDKFRTKVNVKVPLKVFLTGGGGGNSSFVFKSQSPFTFELIHDYAKLLFLEIKRAGGHERSIFLIFLNLHDVFHLAHTP